MDTSGEAGGGGAIFERMAFCKIPPLWRAIIYILASKKFRQFTDFEALFQSVSLEFFTGIKLEKGQPTLKSISIQRPHQGLHRIFFAQALYNLFHSRPTYTYIRNFFPSLQLCIRLYNFLFSVLQLDEEETHDITGTEGKSTGFLYKQ